MKWTSRKPTKPGWYWYRRFYDSVPQIVYVRNYVDELCIVNWPIPKEGVWSTEPIQEPQGREIRRR